MVALYAIATAIEITARYHPAVARALVLAMCSSLAAAFWLGPRAALADGAKTSKVTIETEPPGAKVYFGLKEDGEVCTTPCTIDAPVGETAIIVEAENRRSARWWSRAEAPRRSSSTTRTWGWHRSASRTCRPAATTSRSRRTASRST